MRQAKHMISKYNGKCADCGRPIAAGEPIYWKARGVVQCSDCMPGNDNAPASDTLPNSAAGSWSNALAWNSAPAPGASIGAANPTPAPAPALTKAQALEQIRDHINGTNNGKLLRERLPVELRAFLAELIADGDLQRATFAIRDDSIAIAVKNDYAAVAANLAPSLSDNARAYAAASQPASPAPAFTVVSSSPAPETTPETAPAPAYAPGDDLVTDMLEDNLISLVNAITKLSPDQARFMRDYCEQLTDTRDYTRKHCFTKLAELFGA